MPTLMKIRKAQCPRWAVKALQGLSYWIGYRHSLYAAHPLPEAAMVVETCNLIYANRQHGDSLLCERLYRTLVPKGKWPAEFGNQARTDLVVITGSSPPTNNDENLSMRSFVAIEVKRASSSAALINPTFGDSHNSKKSYPRIARCFL